MKKRIERHVVLHLLVLMAIASYAVAADTKAPPKTNATQATDKAGAKPVSIKERFVVDDEVDGYITVLSLDGADSKVMTFRWPKSGLKRGNVITVTATQIAKDAKPAEQKKGDLTETFTVKMVMEGQIAASSMSENQFRVMTFQWSDDGIKEGDSLAVTVQTMKEADGTAKVVDLDQLQSDKEDAAVQADIDEAIAEENAQRKLANQPKMTPAEELQRRNLLRLISLKIEQSVKDAVDGKKPAAK